MVLLVILNIVLEPIKYNNKIMRLGKNDLVILTEEDKNFQFTNYLLPNFIEKLLVLN